MYESLDALQMTYDTKWQSSPSIFQAVEVPLQPKLVEPALNEPGTQVLRHHDLPGPYSLGTQVASPRP